MKKLFLVFGVIGALCITNGYAEEDMDTTVARAARSVPRVTNVASNTQTTPQNPGTLDMVRPGEVLGAGQNGWMACPPDCSFLRNSNGNLSVPVTCVNHGIECPGGHNGVRFYEDYPSQYAADVTSIGEIQKVDANIVSVKKADTTVAARVARVNKPATTKPGNVTPLAQDKVGTVIVSYNCPAGCELVYRTLSTGATFAECYHADGSHCGSPEVVTAEVGDVNVVARAAKVNKPVTTKPGDITPLVQDKLASDGVKPVCTCPEPGCGLETLIWDGVSIHTCKRSDGTECKINCEMKNTSASGASSARAARMSKVMKDSTKVVPEKPVAQDKLGTIVYNYSCPAGCTRVQGADGAVYCYKEVNGQRQECEVIVEKIDTQDTSASSVRAAKMSKVMNNSVNGVPVTPLTQNSEEKFTITYDGNVYACPGNCKFVRNNGNVVLPPRCDVCEAVVKPVENR